jgi:hypothetical protein
MNNINLDLELEYDLIETKNSDIISSNDIQNDILNLVKLSENVYLHTLNIQQILNNSDALVIYREFETLTRHIFYSIDGQQEYLKLIVSLIKCMRHEHGLNKRLLSYCLLDILSEYNPSLANKIFLSFTSTFGCWKDVKYFYFFCSQIGKECTSPVINYSIQLTNEQLRTDLKNSPNNLSNVAKWIPREKTKYNKLYERLVVDYFNKYNYFSNNDLEKKKKALNKAKMLYRKNLASLNKELDTVQIKQCSKNWQKIDPKTQTSRTLQLQINSFLNLSNNSNKMKYELADRIICSQNFIDDNINNINNYKNNSSQSIVVNSFDDLLLVVFKYFEINL